MEIIPVFDWQAGGLVQARAGDRAAYQPLQSVLTCAQHPLDMITDILRQWPCRRAYLADLDAIVHGKVQWELYQRLAATFPHIRWMIDAGQLPISHHAVAQQIPVDWVVGTESLNAENLQLAWRAMQVLSLDYRHGHLLGPQAVFAASAHWPQEVLLMHLNHVGMHQGPDLARLAQLHAQFPKHRWLCGGGVRSVTDLHQLAEVGASGVLMASAIHQGHLSITTLQTFLADTKKPRCLHSEA